MLNRIKETQIGLMHACSVTKSCPTLQPYGLWTVALQAPLSMGFSRQEYWSETGLTLQCKQPLSWTELIVTSNLTQPGHRLRQKNVLSVIFFSDHHSQYHINMERRIKNFILPFKLHLDVGGTSRDRHFPQKSDTTFSFLRGNACFLHL